MKWVLEAKDLELHLKPHVDEINEWLKSVCMDLREKIRTSQRILLIEQMHDSELVEFKNLLNAELRKRKVARDNFKL